MKTKKEKLPSIKTFDEILLETHKDISRGEFVGQESKLSFRDIERLAAKEYAKQWIKKVIQETHGNESLSVVNDFFKMIDRQ